MYESNTIIKDLRVLTETFIPRRIIHRDGQLHAIRDNLKPLIEKEIARNSFIYGPPGTGKTSMTQYVVDELKAYAPVVSVYINCWLYPSRFKILYNILQSLGQVFIHRKGTPTDELLDLLRQKIKNRPCVIILDEADQLEDDKILYDLASTPEICIILVANKETILYDADPRIRSRLENIERIEFRSYSELEITDILKDRVEWGLVPDVITTLQLSRIAESANGDARKAIGILRSAAETAENQDAANIGDLHIEKAVPKSVYLEQGKTLGNLNTHQKILYGIIKSIKKIPSAELHQKYISLCKEKNLEPQVDRTVRNYLDKLQAYSLISTSGEGRWTVYKAV